MRNLLKEPLLHFLLLGAVMFAAYGWVLKPGSQPGQIVITQGDVESLAEGFSRTWQRPPTDELKGLVRDRVREEVYYREAMALGLDRDDSIIRRRLQQKMEFLTADVAAETQPTDDELSAYLKEHPDSFRLPQIFSFSQIYLNPALHGENLARDAAQLLVQLDADGSKVDPSAMGDPFLMDQTFEGLTASEVGKLFGEDFASKLRQLPPGRWQGPLESGYGSHLVRVNVRTDGRLPPLDEVRQNVEREWANARRVDANEKFYQGLLAHYAVTIDPHAAEQKRVAAK
jgi:PPIC-type PPIASE domain